MATNKHALIRYKVLDKCFRNTGKRYFIEDLMNAVDEVLNERYPDAGPISRRQIFDDMSFMKSSEGWEADLESIRDGQRTYYRYLNRSFSIHDMPLNEMEINQLRSALDILSQFKGLPQFDWMDELLPKLQEGVESKQLETIIEFDSNKNLKGIERLGELYNAIVYRKVLKIKYKPYVDAVSNDVEIHPYYLKQYNNRWFLFGFNPAKEKFDWNMALDRIEDIKEIKLEYVVNDRIDWKEYFEDMIGVTKPENKQPENILLHFYGKTGKYVETKPLHGNQKHKWIDENTLEVRLPILINYELEHLILSYADSVKVLQPPAFAAHISSRLNSALTQYKISDIPS